MKIGNDPKKYMDPNDKDSNDQEGITIGGLSIPYTWIIIGVGVVAMVGIFVSVMVNGESNAAPDPDSEVVETLDEQDNEEEQVEEDSKDRMWDSYLEDAAGTEDVSEEDVSDTDAPEDDEDEEGSADEGAGDSTDEPEAPTVTDEEMAETIKAFLTAFQIYGPGDTEQARYDRIYPYVTEELANELVPNRGAEDAAPSIDVTHELEEIRIDPREGVDNEYVATIIFTREGMGEVLKYTDVYTIRTNGERVTAATIRSSTWE